ncbi:hypothetical protein FB45DRAFT_1007401 [Roridomyces roridus]|uniref:Uncharacterized protein n=1 Tax=Roridomyces roridus TaxID=1738132 RepID=A0AAD7BES8_9AGAR|nr:hypothetical protein FB45DRAFT_1007401 [Roridomyces roridus]
MSLRPGSRRRRRVSPPIRSALDGSVPDSTEDDPIPATAQPDSTPTILQISGLNLTGTIQPQLHQRVYELALQLTAASEVLGDPAERSGAGEAPDTLPVSEPGLS